MTKDDYFEFFVRQFVDLHFLGVGYQTCVSVFDGDLILCDPCRLAFVFVPLKEQTPLQVFIDRFWWIKIFSFGASGWWYFLQGQS